MGLRDFFKKLFSPDPYAPPDGSVDGAPKPSDRGPRPSSPPTRAEPDPLDQISGLAVPEAVRRVRIALDGTTLTRTASLSLLRWLREHASHSDLTPTARVDLADFFLTRADTDTADAIAAGRTTAAAEHAQHLLDHGRGDTAERRATAGRARVAGQHAGELVQQSHDPLLKLVERKQPQRCVSPAVVGRRGATSLAPARGQGLARPG